MTKFFTKFRQDIAVILFFSSGLFVSLSLYSFHPTDPSFNSIGNAYKVSNFCGYFGSFLSDLLYQGFGVGAWGLVAALLIMGVKTLRDKQSRSVAGKFFWGFFLLINASSLLALHLPNKMFFSNQIGAGGLVGAVITHGLIRVFNFAGVAVILWTVFAVLAIFYTERSLREILLAPTKIFGMLAPIGSLTGRIVSQALSKVQPQMRLERKPSQAKNPETKRDEEDKRPVEKLFRFKMNFLDKDKKGAPEEKLALDIKEPRAESTTRGDEVALKPKPFTSSEEPQKVERRKVQLNTKVERRIENWKLPELSMLEDPPASRVRIEPKEIDRKALVLTDKLAQFSVTGEVKGAKPGPAVTMYEFKPSADVKISKITELADDLSLALSSESVRIIAPIPGRDVVGIETSNSQRETVYLKDILASDEFWSDKIKLPLALGRQADGDAKIVDLRKMPHLLVAGTTGSGKSVFVVSMVTGLLFRHSPKTLRLILIDPKQVDLAAFSDIPHLLMPPIREPKKAVTALKWAIREMEKRYRSMSRFACRGLESYNEAMEKLSKSQIEEHDKINSDLDLGNKRQEQYYYTPQPYIVIVVEEFGDLMAVDKVNVEQAVVRLAQMARACGIHLILAMQSPRKDVVTGLIKTNIPGRISFKVASKMDSRIILDDSGAERLLAQGDMLFLAPGVAKPQRHHGPWLTDAEIAAVMKFWSDQGEPQFDPLAIKALEGSGGGFDFGAGGEDGDSLDVSGNPSQEQDEIYDQLLAWVSEQKEVSASLLQRRFKLGYPRAARIIESFEAEGVVGPANGSKPRQVLVTSYKDT